jgi:ribonuclease D
MPGAFVLCDVAHYNMPMPKPQPPGKNAGPPRPVGQRLRAGPLEPEWVAEPARLAALAKRMAREPALAVDTESNSLYAYRERICLIQVSTRTADYLIDPLALDDVSPLGGLLADRRIEKVFHACEYDLICLRRDYGFQVNNVFDTMIAARTLGWPNVGLARIMEELWQVKTNKRYQRADWSHRPLAPEQLSYACLDTHYLLPLRDILTEKLKENGALEEAREEFERLTLVSADHPAFDPDGFWRISGARDLEPREAAVLREVYLYRDRAAQKADRPPFKILGDDTLLAVARAQPRQARDLRGLPGMSNGQIQRHKRGLLEAVQHGQTATLPRRPRNQRSDEATLERYEALRTWRKRRAQARGVDVILARDTLWAIASHNPRTPRDLEHISELGPWRREKYGGEILKLLAEL